MTNRQSRFSRDQRPDGQTPDESGQDDCLPRAFDDSNGSTMSEGRIGFEGLGDQSQVDSISSKIGWLFSHLAGKLASAEKSWAFRGQSNERLPNFYWLQLLFQAHASVFR